LFERVVVFRDCSIICGQRGEEEQNEHFRAGRSKVKFPNSRHNASPSLAVDVIPYPFKPEDWENRELFAHFAGVVRGIAYTMEIPIRWGGDWDLDFRIKETRFFDGPHFELID
jgi:peptidoglycan L-alanyl-D-glutamate endopeptidase CwlK